MELDEGLLKLAETLDSARIQANAMEATAPQRGVYGKVSEALDLVLFLMLGTDRARLAHEELLNGCSVKEAAIYADQEWKFYEEALRGEFD